MLAPSVLFMPSANRQSSPDGKRVLFPRLAHSPLHIGTMEAPRSRRFHNERSALYRMATARIPCWHRLRENDETGPPPISYRLTLPRYVYSPQRQPCATNILKKISLPLLMPGPHVCASSPPGAHRNCGHVVNSRNVPGDSDDRREEFPEAYRQSTSPTAFRVPIP